MMPRRPGKLLCLLFLFIITVFVLKPLPARADGGPIVRYDLWTLLKEGQQTAVVTIQNKDTAKLDLFISLLDKTGESHDVVFFLPLGTSATNFYVVEQELATFNKMTTSGLDQLFRQSERKKEDSLHALFTGTLLSNGVWLLPLWVPMLLTGCAAPSPEATFQTDSSQVNIFSIKEDTDLEALINASGLDISVKETLSRLRGQQIAVVSMQTQPQASDGSGEGGIYSEPGIHLSWATSLVAGESGATYSYPLGTGASWYHPIELTRVYIVAPLGLDFSVSYPALGSRISSFGSGPFHSRIADYYQIPAYAVDDTRGDFGRIWRATYTQSNSAEDIVIVVSPQTGLSRLLSTIEQNVFPLAFAFALIVGLAFWMLAWHFLMPRLLGKQSRQGSRLQWYFGLIYPAINAALVIIPGAILYFVFSFGLAIPAFLFTLLVFGGISILAFILIHARHLDVGTGKALRAFMFTSLASNGAYWLLAFAFAKLSSIL